MMITIEEAIKLHEKGYAVTIDHVNGEPVVIIVEDK